MYKIFKKINSFSFIYNILFKECNCVTCCFGIVILQQLTILLNNLC